MELHGFLKPKIKAKWIIIFMMIVDAMGIQIQFQELKIYFLNTTMGY